MQAGTRFAYGPHGVIRLLVSFLLLVPLALGQSPSSEEEAYTKLVAERDLSRTGNERAARRFESLAQVFLAEHPGSARCRRVRLWQADLTFRHEAPPALEVERWIGTSLDPARVTGSVKVLVFFSDTHPQTRKILPRIAALRTRRGFELAGVAAVIDDHENQRPAVLAKRLGNRKLPFPVAIDKQRAQGPSVSLQRYHCDSVPWIVVIDRYARIAWAGGLSARSLGRIEGKLDELFAQPTYGQLHERVLAGNLSALKTLAGIRTVTTASYLVNVVNRPRRVRLHEATLAVLQELMPTGYLDGNLADALERWRRKKRGVRFSFPANRLVRKR